MQEQFVPYEIALKLKEKGFDWNCLAVYMNGGFQIPRGFGMAIVTKEEVDILKGKAVLAPLWQQVIDWLREKHKLSIEIYNYNNSFGYIWMVKKVDGIYSSGFPEVESTDEVEYQVARIDAIQATLTLI